MVSNNNKQKKYDLIMWIEFILLAILGALIYLYLNFHHVMPTGDDIFGHLYKSIFLLDAWKDHDFFPLYMSSWYNGLEPYRYWAPIPYMLMACLKYITGGYIEGWRLFAGLSYFLGGLPFLILGRDYRKPVFSFAIACLWFFLPENFRVFFFDGNYPRMVSAIVIPFIVLAVDRLLKGINKKRIIFMSFIMMLMSFTHAMITAMTGVGIFLYLVFWTIENRRAKEPFIVLASSAAGIMMSGIWLVPALSGGIVSGDSGSHGEQSMAFWTDTLYNLLSPFHHLESPQTFYYGFFIVLIAIFGAIFAKKENKAGYFLLFFIILLSTKGAVPVLSKLPLNQILWMMRFATIGYAFFLLCLLKWVTLRKSLSAAIIFFMLMDVIPVAKPDYFQNAYKGYEYENDCRLMKKNTRVRLGLFDDSHFGSYPSLSLTTGKDKIDYSFGWAWQGASTAKTMVALNTSAENGDYDYLFANAPVLGDDCVYISKSMIDFAGRAFTDAEYAAKKNGYKFTEEGEYGYIFNLDLSDIYDLKKTEDGAVSGSKIENNFGLIRKYDGLVIGSLGSDFLIKFPDFELGESNYIDDYTFEELSSYKAIYLTGFEYHSKEAAESLVKKLGKAGVNILIDITHMPADHVTPGKPNFLGAFMQDIVFKKYFPMMEYKGNKIALMKVDDSIDEWHAGTVNGTDNAIGTYTYNGRKGTLVGTVKDAPGIFFIGLNLVYNSCITGDQEGLSVVSDILGVSYLMLPETEYVPITLAQEGNTLKIHSPEDNVNTTIAFLDTFKSHQKTGHIGEMLAVNAGDTVIQVTYPMKKEGSIVSLLGLFGIMILLLSNKSKGTASEVKADNEKSDEN